MILEIQEKGSRGASREDRKKDSTEDKRVMKP
jgi:hypothetical protein